MNKKFIFIALILITAFSCKKSFDPGATNAQKVSNEWWINLYSNGSALMAHPAKVLTYNTSKNNDSIWVDDYHNIWDFKVRAKADLTNLTFAINSAQNEYYDITVNITDGKIMPKAGKSATGLVTDSIYFKVEFSDDPGTIYEMKGTARTGWAEDDY